jgi:citrate lyase subunit beta/citryl-CoA lyase
MLPARSLLFVPAHRASWIDKAVSYGADALVLDLEDSVPADQKQEARKIAADRIQELSAIGRRFYVRINRSPFMYSMDDLLSMAKPGVEGIMLSKVVGPEDVDMAARMVSEAESRNGVEIGQLRLLPILEMARAILFAHDIARNSRVDMVLAASARNGDVARSIGYRWTREGRESLSFMSSAVIAIRAAGKIPIAGLWQEIGDLEGLRVSLEQHRNLGFAGEVLLHPTHVPVANAVFRPSEAEITYYKGMIQAFESAQAAGNAAVIYDGEHIDYAHVKTAQEILQAAASSFGGS